MKYLVLVFLFAASLTSLGANEQSLEESLQQLLAQSENLEINVKKVVLTELD